MSHQEVASRGRAVSPTFCAVAPSPELRERMLQELEQYRGGPGELSSLLAWARTPRPLGFDDGTIYPPEEFPAGTPEAVISSAAAERAPLRGTLRVIVVLVDFSDKPMTATTADIDKLFFSLGAMQHGSVREYFRDVTNGLIDIVGETVGPFRMPETMAWYANNNFGIGKPTGTQRARNMAEHAVEAADPQVNFAPYDNDGNGFVDAFIVVHAGRAGDESGNPGHIWSHKSILPAVHNADGTRVFGYLTISEQAKIGVCAHELGHLLFGFPDLYDIDDSSEGVGRWCLMGAGSWGGGGERPTHPSAWCKVNQGWATTKVVTTSGNESFPDVKSSRTVHRLWKNGAGGSEYFLIENRQRTGYDASLPGEGLLIWHIDENQPKNNDENHYKVGLVQADNKRDLELARNRGDDGDPFPGSSGNTTFSSSSTPSSRSYAGADTCVSVTRISPPAATMTAAVSVSCGKLPIKEVKESKEIKEPLKEGKEPFKERKDIKDRKDGAKEDLKEDFKDDLKDGLKEDFKDSLKEDFKDGLKDGKEPFKERKDAKDRKELVKDGKEPFKERKDRLDGQFPQTSSRPAGEEGGSDPTAAAIQDLQTRLTALEHAVGGAGGQSEPFIGTDLRPDLVGGPQYGADAGSLREAVEAGDAQAKRAFDTMPPL
ncbi:M6 family metalloprotease domain-containing protein [Streptomyces purpureus]|uniref:M6 family metalloprotease domain-containing protein n=1 Tax=Streptomyces purpureus TaxID=1951 RepID=UPI0003A6DFB4|nr:M6 family metalloprotease domain-containing protein [Streptomyces purpureus]